MSLSGAMNLFQIFAIQVKIPISPEAITTGHTKKKKTRKKKICKY